MNTFEGFDVKVAENLKRESGYPFIPAINKFEALACHDDLIQFHGALNTLAVALMKIANDI